jgi:hypothetical protein
MRWGYPGIFSSARQKRTAVIMSTFTPNQPAAAPGPKHSKQQGEQTSSRLPFAIVIIPSAWEKRKLQSKSCLARLDYYHHRHHRKSPISQSFTAEVDLLSVSDAVFLFAEKKYKTMINQCLLCGVFL